MRTIILAFSLLAASAAMAQEPLPWATKDLRAGIIGTDTSHVPAFTKLFLQHPEWRIRVVAAYKGGSPDLPVSADRLERFATIIKDEYSVEIVNSIKELLDRVDVVLLESVDGRPHLEQARPVLKAGKRMFIDKPLAASLEDARAIARLSKKTGTPFFSCSSYRFHPDIPRLRDNPGVGKVRKVQGASPYSELAFHPDLFFYGIHGVEGMYAVMGPGCVSVSRKIEGDADITTGQWRDGRVGSYFAVRGKDGPPAVQVWGDDGVTAVEGAGGYGGLVLAVAEFFHTGKAPVDMDETIELFEFMTAAQLSKERDGKEVALEELR